MYDGNFSAGWQTISLQNMVYKKRMSQIKIELVDILEVNTEQRYSFQQKKLIGQNLGVFNSFLLVNNFALASNLF